MEAIQKGKYNKTKVLEEAREALTVTLEKFKREEKEIGEDLIGSLDETERIVNQLGKCPKCKSGTLTIMRSRNGGRFVGCSSYPKCNNIYPLPRQGMIKKTDKICEKCNTPIVIIINKGRRPWNLCLDPKCPTKKDWNTKKTKKKIKKS
ncbi:MAG: topoisomerase DNA-binding C4 zinc finger domain-containing protein [Candidatus Omnitrophica bacterium]|nr:topoisomerase DNA-binding C4 zinc finger domain-containing protein [Candidatus Omnitrophota bacterium]